jgi:D-beta-D-heptose 7-phosphate kinase/D-beta-D-heptose 1-phosphate adenosyltransferase
MRVFVVGDLILDHYINGSSTRLSPEAPVPVVSNVSDTYSLGGAANVAANLSDLNVKVHLYTRLSPTSDPIVTNLLNEYSIYCYSVNSLTPPVKTRVVVDGHHIVRIDRETISPISTQEADQLLLNIESAMFTSRPGCIVISDYGKGFITKYLSQSLIKLAHRYDIPVLVDPKSKDLSTYSGCYAIKPNGKETLDLIQSLGGKTLSDYHLLPKDISNYLFTNADQPTIHWDTQTNISTTFPISPLEVVDVSGAGDIFIAAVASGICQELPMHQIIPYANHLATLSCSKLGTTTIGKL